MKDTPDLLTLLHVISPSLLVSTPHFAEVEFVCSLALRYPKLICFLILVEGPPWS